MDLLQVQLLKMNLNLQTVRKLFFVLIIASAVCTVASYLLVVHYYCCPENQSTRISFSSFVSSVNARSVRRIVVINRATNATMEKTGRDFELQEYLRKSGQASKILKVNLNTVGNDNERKSIASSIVYTLERFPVKSHNEMQGSMQRLKRGKAKSTSKSRGYFFSFSFSGDQLSAATRRLFKLNALAKYGERLVVEPLVKDSSFFGDQLTRMYPPLKPLSLYYDMGSVNDLLERYGYARFANRQRFLGACRQRTGTLYVRLLPNAWHRSRINFKPEVSSLVAQSVKKGLLRCALPLPRFQDFALMRQLRIVRQVCVNTDVVRNFTKFHDDILDRYKCVVFHHWSGTGEKKGNYFTSQTTKLPPLELTHLLQFSSGVIGKARQFVASALGNKPYISIHVRAERFFRISPNFTENFSHFLRCSEFLVKLVDSLKQFWKIQQVFLASDLGESGSSGIARGLERTSGYDRARVKKLVESLVDYQDGVIRKLKPVVREVTEKGDKGVEALVDMHILKDGNHLVTMGSGLTWQLWLVDVFRQRQEQQGKTNYSVVKLC